MTLFPFALSVAGFGLLVLYDCARCAYREGRHGEALCGALALGGLWAGVWGVVLAGMVR